MAGNPLRTLDSFELIKRGKASVTVGGLAAGIMARLGFMKSFPKALITACVAGFVAVLISTPLNVIFWGGTTGNVWGDMVFAATQAGHASRGEQALAAVARVIAGDAGQWPLAQWPPQYWRL